MCLLNGQVGFLKKLQFRQSDTLDGQREALAMHGYWAEVHSETSHIEGIDSEACPVASTCMPGTHPHNNNEQETLK